MKHIKKFESFNIKSILENFSEVPTVYGPGEEEHLRFCQEATEWINQTGEPIKWCFYAHPGSGEHPVPRERENFSGFYVNRGTKEARRFWNIYVKDASTLEVVKMGDKLVAYIVTDGEISHGPFDNYDLEVDRSLINFNI